MRASLFLGSYTLIHADHWEFAETKVLQHFENMRYRRCYISKG